MIACTFFVTHKSTKKFKWQHTFESGDQKLGILTGNKSVHIISLDGQVKEFPVSSKYGACISFHWTVSENLIIAFESGNIVLYSLGRCIIARSDRMPLNYN